MYPDLFRDRRFMTMRLGLVDLVVMRGKEGKITNLVNSVTERSLWLTLPMTSMKVASSEMLEPCLGGERRSGFLLSLTLLQNGEEGD